MDGCAIIDARRRESVETGPLWRANATTTGKVQTGAWKSRLHSGNTEQDMRNALVKSFMCDHYSKTMHWAATDRDPARYGIRGRSEYWLHRPSPTLQHRERAFFFQLQRKKENRMGSDHRTTSLGIEGGIKNLLRRAARFHRVDPLEPVGGPVRDEAEAQEVWSLLAEEIEHRWNGSLPDSLAEDDGALRPTLIGLWAEDRLIGGAFVRPAVEEATAFATHGWKDAAQVIRERVCITEAIAVRGECRGKGIGLQIKRYCDAWAREHHAPLMLSIPTNEGARRLNEKAGHTVLDTDVSMVLQLTCDGEPLTGGVTFHREQTEGYSAWAFKVLAETQGVALRVGQCPYTAVEASTESYDSIIWLDSTDPAAIPQ